MTPFVSTFSSSAKSLLKESLPEGKLERGGFLLFFAGLLAVLAGAFLEGSAYPNLVRYWNVDDANILSYYGHLYTQGALAPVEHIGYPFFFYYASAPMIVPFFLALGPDPQAIVLGWRLTNYAAFLGTNLLLFLVARRHFRTGGAGLLAAFLYSTTYPVLIRNFMLIPQSFEAFLNLAMLVTCFELARKYSPKKLVLAALLAAFSFSTKYHGPFLLPALYVSLLYASGTRPEADNARSIRRGATAGGICAGISLALVLSVSHLMGEAPLWLSRFPDSPLVKKLFGGFVLSHALQYAQILFGISLIALLSGLGAHFVLRREHPGGSFAGAIRRIGAANGLFFPAIAVFTAAVAATNPYLFVYPRETLDVFLRIYEMVSEGVNWNIEAYGASRGWLKVLSEPPGLGAAGIGLLLFAAAFEAFRSIKRPEADFSRPFRVILWTHAGVYLGYLVLRVHLLKHHYVCPVAPDIALLSSFAALQAVRSVGLRPARTLAAGTLALLIGAGLLQKGDLLHRAWRWGTRRDRDGGVLAARWINERYAGKPRILCDLLPISYLVRGEPVAGGFLYSKKILLRILARVEPPDLLILMRDENASLARELGSDYRVVYSAPYDGLAEEEMQMIMVLARKTGG